MKELWSRPEAAVLGPLLILFLLMAGGSPDGTLLSLIDDRELDEVEMLNDDISTQRHKVMVQISQDEA